MIFKSVKLVNALSIVPITALIMSSSFITIANAETSTSGTSHEHMEKGGGSHEMMDSMKTGMETMQNMEMSGDVDKDFAMMMKMHHQQALDMAKMELAHGKSPEMKAMAKKIMIAQKKEIAQFDKWLAKQK
jgi:uncharacterized protein (DUF305 family)